MSLFFSVVNFDHIADLIVYVVDFEQTLCANTDPKSVKL